MSDQTQTWLANVEWTPTGYGLDDTKEDLPYATHTGVFVEPIFGTALRCYRLSDGRAIFNADDFKAFMARIELG